MQQKAAKKSDMIKPFKELTTYEGNDFVGFIKKILLYEVFKDLINEYGHDKGLLKQIIKYIVWAYSMESEKVVLGMDWEKNKKRIFDEAELPPSEEMQEAVIYLKDEAILNTINKWLDFQDEEAYTQYCALKDLRVEMQVSSLRDIKKASGEIDYDQKFRNAQYAKDLLGMIKDVEAQLIQNDIKLKDAVKEVKKSIKKDTFGVESYAV